MSAQAVAPNTRAAWLAALDTYADHVIACRPDGCWGNSYPVCREGVRLAAVEQQAHADWRTAAQKGETS